MDDRALAEELTAFVDALDLGEYDVDVYLGVLEHGELTASEVAEVADVPQPRVYDTVRGLADRGLVELHESRPMRVVAIPPETAFDRIRADLTDLIEGLESLYTEPAGATEAVTLVKSRSTILRYIRDVIETAEYELSASVGPDLLANVESEFAAAMDRGASVELIVAPASAAPEPDAFDYERVATRARARRGVTAPVILVADGEYSIFATRSALREGSDEYGVIFNRSELGFLASAFFGTVLWTTADRTLATDGRPTEFPRRYASIRRCIKDLREMTGQAYARIEGRDVSSGTARQITGAVAEAHITADEEVATLTVDTETGPVDVGGRVAAYEDVEAHRIEIDTDPFD